MRDRMLPLVRVLVGSWFDGALLGAPLHANWTARRESGRYHICLHKVLELNAPPRLEECQGLTLEPA